MSAERNFWLDLAQGQTPGLRRYVISAFAPDIDTADTPMGIHPNPVKGTYPAQAAAVGLEVVSSSAADAAAGTGARTVTLQLLNNSFAPSTQVVTLNGTTPVAVPGGAIYRRVNRMDVATVGSGFVAAGNLTCRVAGGGIWQRYIPAGEAGDRVGFFCIPANMYGTLMAGSFDVEKATNEEIRVVVIGQEASVPGPAIIEREWPFLNQVPEPELRGNRLQGPRDLFIRTTATTGNNIRIVGRIFLVLEDA